MRGQRIEIAGYVTNPKATPWMAEWLLERYDSFCDFDVLSGTAMVPPTDEHIDIMLAKGELTGTAMTQSELFLLVAARTILRVQAGRSDEEIAQYGDGGTKKQRQAQEAQKEAVLYVSRLFSDHPDLTPEWIYPKSVDQQG